MGLFSRKSFKITPSVRLHIGKKSISTTFKLTGMRIRISKKFSKKRLYTRSKAQTTDLEGYTKDDAIQGAILLGIIIGAIIFVVFDKFFISLIPVFLIPVLYVFISSGKQNTKIKQPSQVKPINIKSNKTPNITPIKLKIQISSTPEQIIENNPTEIIPIQARLNSLYPNKAGLYPHEILALQMFPVFKLDNNKVYPKYWWHQYGVRDVPRLMASLKNRGFLEYAGVKHLKNILESHKVSELKQIIKKYGLKIPQKKADMIQAMLLNIPKTDLMNIFLPIPHNYYVLTEKGNLAIEDDEYVIYAHRSKYEEINIYNLNQEMHGDTKNYKYYVRIIIENNYKKALTNQDYSLRRTARFHLSDFIEHEGNILEALKMLAEVIYLDLSGIYLGFYPGKKTNIPLLYRPTFTVSMFDIPPGIIGKLYEYQERLQLSNKELAKILFHEFKKLSLPFHIFTNIECTKITLFEIEGSNEEIKKIYALARDRLRKQYPTIIFD